MGDDTPAPCSADCHATFVVVFHVDGNGEAAATPVAVGPRQCGQSLALTPALNARTIGTQPNETLGTIGTSGTVGTLVLGFQVALQNSPYVRIGGRGEDVVKTAIRLVVLLHLVGHPQVQCLVTTERHKNL